MLTPIKTVLPFLEIHILHVISSLPPPASSLPSTSNSNDDLGTWHFLRINSWLVLMALG